MNLFDALNEIVCVRNWFLFVFGLSCFLLGYFGDIFLRKDKE